MSISMTMLMLIKLVIYYYLLFLLIKIILKNVYSPTPKSRS